MVVTDVIHSANEFIHCVQAIAIDPILSKAAGSNSVRINLVATASAFDSAHVSNAALE
jgi:hypothetical protein